MIPPGAVGGIFVVAKPWAEANKDAVSGMQAALDEALAYIRANPDLARASLVQYTTLPPKVIASLKWPNFSHPPLGGNQPEILERTGRAPASDQRAGRSEELRDPLTRRSEHSPQPVRRQQAWLVVSS